MNSESFLPEQTEETLARGEPDGAAREAVTFVFQEQIRAAVPNAVEQSRLFDLLGRINYLVLRGDRMYVQVGGRAFKVLHGVYWQSVFSGRQHWGLRCAEVGNGAWAQEPNCDATWINLPLRYTTAGWVIESETFNCRLYGDLLALKSGDLYRIDAADLMFRQNIFCRQPDDGKPNL